MLKCKILISIFKIICSNKVYPAKLNNYLNEWVEPAESGKRRSEPFVVLFCNWLLDWSIQYPSWKDNRRRNQWKSEGTEIVNLWMPIDYFW